MFYVPQTPALTLLLPYSVSISHGKRHVSIYEAQLCCEVDTQELYVCGIVLMLGVSS